MTEVNVLHQRRALVLLAFAAFASTAAVRVCDPMLPQLAQAFSTTAGQAASVVTVFAVAYGVLQLFYGPLGDHFGKYRVVSLATLACALASLGCAFAPSIHWLIVARFLAGATAAAIVPLSVAWIGDNVPYERRQASIARFLVGSITGMVAGSLLGGLFADTLGWRAAFVALALVYLGVGGMLQLEHRRQIFGTIAADRTSPAKFQLWSQTQRVLRAPWARVVLVTVFTESVMLFGALAFIPVYLHAHFGLSLFAAGAMAAFFGVGGLGYVAFAPRLLRSLGEKGLAITAGLSMFIAFLFLRFAPTAVLTVPAIFTIGLGFFMLHNTLQTNATQMVSSARGTAVSLFASSAFTGQAVGVALASLIVDAAGVPWLFVMAAVTLPVIAFTFARMIRRRPATQ
ncbi:MAG TPA: MFS transporter [Burkholderiaceae bacterium]|nr:MFS transporter [Burkholderiaceae bacterium]